MVEQLLGDGQGDGGEPTPDKHPKIDRVSWSALVAQITAAITAVDSWVRENQLPAGVVCPRDVQEWIVFVFGHHFVS